MTKRRLISMQCWRTSDHMTYSGEILQNALRILQRIPFHVIMWRQGQQLVQGDNVRRDLGTKSVFNWVTTKIECQEHLTRFQTK